MLFRHSHAADVAPIRELTAAAFASAPHAAPPVDGSGQPGEAALVQWLLEDRDAVAALSVVAVHRGRLVGHVVCSHGRLGDGDGRPALALGPISVDPAAQRSGTGSALVQTVLGAADALGEPLVVLLGDPGFYSRLGFEPAARLAITAPDPAWGDLFQARTLTSYDDSWRGPFRYHPAFDRLG